MNNLIQPPSCAYTTKELSLHLHNFSYKNMLFHCVFEQSEVRMF